MYTTNRLPKTLHETDLLLHEVARHFIHGEDMPKCIARRMGESCVSTSFDPLDSVRVTVFAPVDTLETYPCLRVFTYDEMLFTLVKNPAAPSGYEFNINQYAANYSMTSRRHARLAYSVSSAFRDTHKTFPICTMARGSSYVMQYSRVSVDGYKSLVWAMENKLNTELAHLNAYLTKAVRYDYATKKVQSVLEYIAEQENVLLTDLPDNLPDSVVGKARALLSEVRGVLEQIYTMPLKDYKKVFSGYCVLNRLIPRD